MDDDSSYQMDLFPKSQEISSISVSGVTPLRPLQEGAGARGPGDCSSSSCCVLFGRPLRVPGGEALGRGNARTMTPKTTPEKGKPSPGKSTTSGEGEKVTPNFTEKLFLNLTGALGLKIPPSCHRTQRLHADLQ